MSDSIKNHNQIQAPWTAQQVVQLNYYQNCGVAHPFTCGQRDDHKGEGVLIAHADGWTCPECDYTQSWAWSHMADGSIQTLQIMLDEISGKFDYDSERERSRWSGIKNPV